MPRGGRTWTLEEERKLIEMIDQGVTRPVIANALLRTVAAIEARFHTIKLRKFLDTERSTRG